MLYLFRWVSILFLVVHRCWYNNSHSRFRMLLYLFSRSQTCFRGHTVRTIISRKTCFRYCYSSYFGVRNRFWIPTCSCWYNNRRNMFRMLLYIFFFGGWCTKDFFAFLIPQLQIYNNRKNMFRMLVYIYP